MGGDTSLCEASELMIELPSLVDLQINGWAGIDFNAPDLTVDAVHHCASEIKKTGTGLFLPTVVTNDPAAMERSLAVLADAASMGSALAGAAMANAATADAATTGGARARGPAAFMIAGIHLEGPFISDKDGPRGAHPREYVSPVSLDVLERLYRASCGLLKIVTFAPEVACSDQLIDWCVRRGVIAAIGHTGADTAQIRRACALGARMSTHLGNAISLMLPRHPNPIWDQLAEDSLAASCIADGHHLPVSVLKVMARVKGKDLILVSDATKFGGMPPGIYDTLIGGRVELDGAGRLSMVGGGGALAGAARSLSNGVFYGMHKGLWDLKSGWFAASGRPARLLGIKKIPGKVLVDPGSGSLEIIG